MMARLGAFGAALSIIACVTSAPAALAAPAPGYRLESAVVLKGASPSWDYLTIDPVHGHLFIGRRSAGVIVYDTITHKLVGTIDNSGGANIARLAPDLDRGFTANEDGSTTIFQISNLKTLGRVKLGPAADAAFFEPVTGQVVYTLGDSHELVFLDARTAAITGRVTIAADELEAAVADGRGYLYVNERDRNRIAKVDARSHKVVAEWPTTGCDMPTGLDIDAASRRLFVGCKGAHPVLAVMDADTGRVVASQEIGRGNDGVVYDPQTRRIFTANGLDGLIVVVNQIDADHYSFGGAVTTRPIARTLALDPTTRKIYTVTAEGIVDPASPVNRRAGPFYPNHYLDNTFTVLTYAPN